MRIPICGIEIDKKTDILSLAAFLLALAGILYQVYGFFQGPQVILFPPEQIAISPFKIVPTGKEYVRFVVPMSYVNKAQPGYNAVVKKELITFTLGDQSYVHKWQEFGSSTSDNGNFAFVKKSDAQPITINSGSSESHETFFAPFSLRATALQKGEDKYKNYLQWQTFLAELSKNKKIRITVVAEIYSKADLKLKCELDFNDPMIEFLVKKKWTAPAMVCVPVEQGTFSFR
jgi:hypothetical protein